MPWEALRVSKTCALILATGAFFAGCIPSENAYKEKEQQHEEEKARFHKLKEDFKYNLKLLEDRDLELEKYDSYTAGQY